ncbi:MAG: ABC transporter ATP-binding protein [Planctomycetaceae bacterium]|nr:ABC transporter ATP-binding protein [Planctomycetaceae bacterium]
MSSLVRALGMALRYRWSFFFTLVTTVGVAILWGANISTVAPFIKVIFEGQNLHQWINDRRAEAEVHLQTAQAEIQSLELQIAGNHDPTTHRNLMADLSDAQQSVSGYSTSLWLTDQLEPWIAAYAPASTYDTLVFLILLVIAATVLRGCLLAVNMYLVARLGQRTVLDIQNQFLRNTLHLDLSEIGKNGTGDLINRIRGETNAIGMAITTILGKIIREPLKMVVCLAGAAFCNWRLLLFTLIICPLAGVLLVVLAKSIKRLNRRAVEESARLLNRLFQSITYIKAVKSFNMEAHEIKRFQVIANDVYQKNMRVAYLGSLARMNSELMGVGIVSLGILAGGYLVLNQETRFLGLQLSDTPMKVETMMLFFSFLIAAADPVRKMSDVYAMIQGGIVSAERVFPLLDKQTTIHSPPNPVPIITSPPKLEFQNVRFAYNEAQPVLNGINLTVPAGKTVAIVGANGCGKSTLVNFLPRFFDPDAGSVKLNGTDVRDFDLHELRSVVGLVTQHSMLFDDTVGNNIAYGSEHATREQIIAAAKQASAHTFIESQLENGYDSGIGEHGGKLSGGQRQRIELARIILKNPLLLVLDEATSQIDPTSEQLIHDSLRNFVRGRTVLMITHRLSSLDLADLVVVMHEGEVVDTGTHAELMARCGLFREMLRTSQSEELSVAERAKAA